MQVEQIVTKGFQVWVGSYIQCSRQARVESVYLLYVRTPQEKLPPAGILLTNKVPVAWYSIPMYLIFEYEKQIYGIEQDRSLPLNKMTE